MISFFKKSMPKITEKEVDNLLFQIDSTLQNLGKVNRKKFSLLLEQRQRAFKEQILQKNSESEKEKFIRSYLLFANTITNCIKHPNNIQQFMDDYYDSPDYRHVGGTDGRYSYTLFDGITSHLVKLGVGMLVLSAVAFPFSMPIGLIALGITISILLPSLFYALAETLPNEIKVKKEEYELFTETQSLFIPRPNNDSPKGDEFTIDPQPLLC